MERWSIENTRLAEADLFFMNGARLKITMDHHPL
jgi:hypothetical protein